MKTALRLLRLMKPFSGWVALSILLGSAAVSAGIGLLGTSAFLIARAAQQPSIAVLQVAIAGVRFFGISRGVFRYLERLVSHSVNFRLLAQLRSAFYHAVEPLAPARLQTYQSGDLLSRAVADIDTLEHFYVRAVAPPVVALIVTAGVSLFAGAYHPALGWALLAGLILGGGLVPLLTRIVSRRAGRAMVLHRARLRASIVDGIQGMPDLLSNHAASRHMVELERISAQLGRSQQRTAWSGGLSSGLLVLAGGLTLWLVLWIAIPLTSAGALDGVSLAVLALVTMASFEAVQPLGQAAQQLDSSLQSAQRLFDLSDERTEVVEPAAPCQPRDSSLRVRGLTFRYAPDLPDALHEIDFDLPAGKRLAIVGPSGAGKTTLANLLLRLWEYQQGSITLGGCELRQAPAEQVRHMIGVVSQRTYLFTGTLRHNLLLADPVAGDGDLWEALEQAGLAEWVRGLAHGMDTWTGERGVQMSGGERQRLALARCLLQKAPILLLDEPAASLDALIEQRLMAALAHASLGRSVLWITHRLTGLESMDEILVLDAGRIVQRGVHAQLVAQPGLYARMWTLQNRILLDLPGTSGLSPAL